MRAFFLFLLAFAATPALGQTVPTCIPLEQSWTQQFQGGTIPYITYQIPNQLLIQTQSRSTKFMHVLLKVPQSVAQRLQSLTSADTYFRQILPQYHEALLNENGCPLLYEPTPGRAAGANHATGNGLVMTGASLILTLGPNLPAMAAIGNFAPIWSR